MQLATEFTAACGHRLFMMRPSELLLRAGAVEVTVSSASVDDVERVSREVSERPAWSPTGVFALLENLTTEGWDHAEVIRAAARNGGIVDRETVYEICGYDDDRMLRGFTRPSARITAALQRQGVIADGVEPALTAVYEGGVKAVTFRIPKEMVLILAKDSENGEFPRPIASPVDHASVDGVEASEKVRE
jgi:hypothetical protein